MHARWCLTGTGSLHELVLLIQLPTVDVVRRKDVLKLSPRSGIIHSVEVKDIVVGMNGDGLR